jgi:transposase
MREKSTKVSSPSERSVKSIRRATRKQYSAEEKIRIVLDGLRGESSIAELCRREGIAEGLYYSWSKEFLEAGKRRRTGDTARAATSSEVTGLRREAQALHREDHRIRHEERKMASLNGGHITRGEQRVLNQQENRVSRQIGR